MTDYGQRQCIICGACFDAKSSTAKCCSPDCAKLNKQNWSSHYYAVNREKFIERSREWQRDNPEKMLERSRRYEAAHREARTARKRDPKLASAQSRRYYLKNADAQRERSRVYTAAHPEVSREHMRRRRAAQRGTSSALVTPRDLERALRRHDGRCTYCGSDLTGCLEWDHVVPLARGGRHSIGNLVPSCASCNRRKQARTVMEWRVKSRI